MTCAVTIDVHAPAAACQALHAQHLEPTGGQGRQTAGPPRTTHRRRIPGPRGWDTKASYDRFHHTVIAPPPPKSASPPAGWPVAA